MMTRSHFSQPPANPAHVVRCAARTTHALRLDPHPPIRATTTRTHPDPRPPVPDDRTPPPVPSAQALVGSAATGPRRATANAITRLEPTRADHRAQADELLTAWLPHAGKSLRLGISGVPGVGKSTFIEVLGLYLIAQGRRVAVLAIDPSSTKLGRAPA